MSWLHRVLGRDGTSQLAVDANLFAAAMSARPLPYGSGGHYRTSVRFTLTNTQAANSRLWQVRNTSATLLVVPTRLTARWLQTGAHTALIKDTLEFFKLTSFSAVDTTNTVTPTVSKKRTTGMGAVSAAIRHVTVAGAAAGMTGGTLTKDGNAFARLSKILQAAVPTGSAVDPSILDALDDVNGTHPFVLEQNEGIGIENLILLGAAAASEVEVDFSWAEVPLTIAAGGPY